MNKINLYSIFNENEINLSTLSKLRDSRNKFKGNIKIKNPLLSIFK
jgi:hypothetical protein